MINKEQSRKQNLSFGEETLIIGEQTEKAKLINYHSWADRAANNIL